MRNKRQNDHEKVRVSKGVDNKCFYKNTHSTYQMHPLTQEISRFLVNITKCIK